MKLKTAIVTTFTMLFGFLSIAWYYLYGAITDALWMAGYDVYNDLFYAAIETLFFMFTLLGILALWLGRGEIETSMAIPMLFGYLSLVWYSFWTGIGMAGGILWSDNFYIVLDWGIMMFFVLFLVSMLWYHAFKKR